MSAKEIAELLRDIGFPAFVSIWFMLRLEKRIDRVVELQGAHMQKTALLAQAIDHQNDTRRLTGNFPALTEEGDDESPQPPAVKKRRVP